MYKKPELKPCPACGNEIVWFTRSVVGYEENDDEVYWWCNDALVGCARCRTKVVIDGRRYQDYFYESEQEAEEMAQKLNEEAVRRWNALGKQLRHQIF